MNHELPYFSVIVPTYERPEQLRMCLAAISRLDYPAGRFEVIVVDDGSREPLAEIAAAFRDAIDVRLIVQKNAGPGAARNRAAADARGEFFVFTDDDCTVDAGWLLAFAAHFNKSSGTLAGGQTVNGLESNRCSATSQMIMEVVYLHYNADPDDAGFFASNNFAMAAEQFWAVGGFDETFRTAEDREFCDRWRARGLQINYVPAALINHAHPLTASSLWKQHFAYGRGARRFHQIRVARGAPPFKLDLTFYMKLLRASCSQVGWSQSLVMPIWLFWSLLANTAGFFCERKKEGELQTKMAEPM